MKLNSIIRLSFVLITTVVSANAQDLPSFLIGTQTGEGTYYVTGGAYTACGVIVQDTDFIAAVGHDLYDHYPGYFGTNPNNNPLCGRTATATYQGRSVVVRLVDRCTGCALTDLDFSPAAYSVLTNGDFNVGRIQGVQWTWN